MQDVTALVGQRVSGVALGYEDLIDHHALRHDPVMGAERSVSPVMGRIRAARTVNKSGRIAYREIAIDSRDLASSDRAGLLGCADQSGASFNEGVAAVLDGFGRTETLAEFRTASNSEHLAGSN